MKILKSIALKRKSILSLFLLSNAKRESSGKIPNQTFSLMIILISHEAFVKSIVSEEEDMRAHRHKRRNAGWRSRMFQSIFTVSIDWNKYYEGFKAPLSIYMIS